MADKVYLGGFGEEVIGYIVGLIGMAIFQDALASIAFYPKESWRWNHTARLVRVVFGLILMSIGALLVIRG